MQKFSRFWRSIRGKQDVRAVTWCSRLATGRAREWSARSPVCRTTIFDQKVFWPCKVVDAVGNHRWTARTGASLGRRDRSSASGFRTVGIDDCQLIYAFVRAGFDSVLSHVVE